MIIGSSRILDMFMVLDKRITVRLIVREIFHFLIHTDIQEQIILSLAVQQEQDGQDLLLNILSLIKVILADQQQSEILSQSQQ